MAATQQAVGQQAAEQRPDKTADGWQRSDEACGENGHAARLYQVHGEPGQEKVGDRIVAVLAEIHPDQGTLAEQQLEVAPLRLRPAAAAGIEVDQPATRLDVAEFGR